MSQINTVSDAIIFNLEGEVEALEADNERLLGENIKLRSLELACVQLQSKVDALRARIPNPDDLRQVCDMASAYLDLADGPDVDLETVALVRGTLPKEEE